MQASSNMAAPSPSSHVASAARTGGPTDPAHDARLRRGIIDTRIARSVAYAMTGCFLVLIYGVPVSQILLEMRAGEDSSLAGIFQRAPTRENLQQLEKEIEDASYAKELVQPHIQLALSRFGRAGNKRALIGRDGWLYYTPGVRHLAGPNFLDPDALQLRAADHPEEQPDPRPAIFDFQRMLSQRGIALVLLIIPDKSALQPAQLHGRADPRRQRRVAQNLGWKEFSKQVQAHGVVLFDPSPAQLTPGEPARFLIQDTHWTPDWMERVARDLASVVARSRGPQAPARARSYHAVPQRVERVGDLVDMLKLPDDQTLFTPQALTTSQVQDETGALWEQDPSADVLLLGDSFSNVFSLDAMGWGEAAGLAPQLALALGSAVDVIAQNDSGAFATRQALARELSAGEDRLRGKRVVIWELAARELSVGDWKSIHWNTPNTHDSGAE